MSTLSMRSAALAAILAAGLGSAITAVPASAQSGPPVYDYGNDGRITTNTRPASPMGTRVYGWSAQQGPRAFPVAPADCGVYRYWNGAYCVDARVTPPPLE